MNMTCMGERRRANDAAEADELVIVQAMSLASEVGLPGVVDHLAAAETRLAQLRTTPHRGTDLGGRPLTHTRRV